MQRDASTGDETPAREEPPQRLSPGLFVAAFLIGLGGMLWGTFLTLPIVALLRILGVSGSEQIYAISVPCFSGGFYSGWALGSGVRGRRYRLLYLLAASPAMPIWFGSLLAAAAGYGVRPAHVLLVGVLCASAMVGSLLGYGVSIRNLSRDSRPPPCQGGG